MHLLINPIHLGISISVDTAYSIQGQLALRATYHLHESYLSDRNCDLVSVHTNYLP